MAGGTVLITEDDRGIARALAAASRSRGWQTAMIGGPDSRDGLDFSGRGGRRHQTVRGGMGPLAGLVHLLPLRSASQPGARRGRLGRPDEPRGPRALLAGEGNGRRPRARGRARRSLPDRRDGHGRSIRQLPGEPRPTSFPARGHRGVDQDDRTRVDLGPDPRDRPGRQRRNAGDWPTGSWPRFFTTTPGRRSATWAAAGSVCRPMPAPLICERPVTTDFRCAPGEPVLITGGARHHLAGRCRAGAALAADSAADRAPRRPRTGRPTPSWMG